MKPILFNTEMVKTILDGRKSVTRRVVKPPALDRLVIGENGELLGSYDTAICDEAYPTVDDAPYRPGDILYVRETWNYGYCDRTDFECRPNEPFFEELTPGSKVNTYLIPRYFYRTEDLDGIAGMKWRPSIHMPKEAARLFLRVTDVRVEQLQDVSGGDLLKEGIDLYQSRFVRVAFDEFAYLWDSTIKKADLPLYGWDANPWVWVIEFERIDKEEG